MSCAILFVLWQGFLSSPQAAPYSPFPRPLPLPQVARRQSASAASCLIWAAFKLILLTFMIKPSPRRPPIGGCKAAFGI